jgi:multicomponent Na+:H+ antiporter subunit D
VLLALGGEPAQVQGAIKYVTLNLMASALFLAAVGILYGLVGTLNMADLARQFRTSAPPGLVTTLGILFLVAFGIKAAVVPLHFWLPSSYHTPPAPVSAIFAGLLTKVGVYALIRVFTLLFIQDIGYTHSIILIIAGLTMTVGILGAIAQNEFRRILSFNLVSHIGYIIMGLGLFTPVALAGAIFYLIHDIIVKTNLFMIGGSIQRLQGTGKLRKLGGLYVAYPSLALPFLIAAFSLAGVPPLSGFWPKLALLQAGLEMRQYAIVIIALAVSLLTLLSMMRIWQEVFLKDRPDDSEIKIASPLSASQWTASLLPILILVAITVIIGLAAEPVFKLSMLTAEQLLDPTDYIQTVLNN